MFTPKNKAGGAMSKEWYITKYRSKVTKHINDIFKNISIPVFSRRKTLSMHDTEFQYLNTAGIGRTLRPSFEETFKYNEFLTKLGLLTAEGLAHFYTAPYIFRQKIAELLKCCPDELTFFENSSQAINIILNSIDFNYKDIILTSDQEHPSGYLPLKRLSEKKDLMVYFIPYKKPLSFIKSFENIYKLSKDKTRLVFLSLASFCTGSILPLKEILSRIDRTNTLIYIDAAQYAGLNRLDLKSLNADFVSFPGHKWYHGPLGTCVLYINKKVKDRIDPAWISYNSILDTGIDDDIKIKQNAERFLCGTYDISRFLGLTVSMMILDRYHDDIVPLYDNNFRTLYSRLADKKKIELYTRETNITKGIISFKSKDALPHTIEQEACENHRIILKAINYPERFPCIRISPGFIFGTEPEKRLYNFIDNL